MLRLLSASLPACSTGYGVVAYCMVPRHFHLDRERFLVKSSQDIELDLCARDLLDCAVGLVLADVVLGVANVDVHDALFEDKI